METDAKDTKLKSPLEDLYDDFEDFDLGKTVERLRKEIKTLRDHIKNQDNDIEKLADALVEMKTVNENLTKNISSLFMTSKTELERKDNIIADLRLQLDNFTFRRHGSNFQNSKRVIPQNKETAISGVVPNLKHEHPELPYNQKEDSVQNIKPEIKPELANVQNRNIERRPGSSNRGNVFQERVRKNMHKWVKTEQLDLPLPSFADFTSEKHANQSARDNRYQDMHRNNNFEEPENQSCDKHNSYQDHRSRFETKPEYRRDRSTHRRKWEYDRHEDRRRDDTIDNFSKRKYDPRANDNVHSSYERSKSRNREPHDPRTDGNPHYSYERSKSRNREPPVHITDDNSHASRERSKSSNREPHVPRTDENWNTSRERGRSRNKEPHVPRTDDNFNFWRERSKSRNREPHVDRTDDYLHYSYERSKSRNREPPVHITDDNSHASRERSKSSNREPHVPKTDDNWHTSLERGRSRNREPRVDRTDTNLHYSYERGNSRNRDPAVSRTDDNSHPSRELSKSSNREPHLPRTDDNSNSSLERSKSRNREPHIARTDDTLHYSYERSTSRNIESPVPRKETTYKYEDNEDNDENEMDNKKYRIDKHKENEENDEQEKGKSKQERKDKYKEIEDNKEKENEMDKKKERKDNLDTKENEKGNIKQKEQKDNLNKEHDENDRNGKGMEKKKKRKDKYKPNDESGEKKKNKEKESKDHNESHENDEKEKEIDKKKERKDKCKQNEESDEKEKDKKKERKDNLDNKEYYENDEKEKKCKEEKTQNETESDNNSNKTLTKNDFTQQLNNFLDSVMHKITVSNGNTEPTQSEEKYLDLESIIDEDDCNVIEPKPELFKPPFKVTNSGKKIKKISDMIDVEDDARDMVNTNEIDDIRKLDNGDEKVSPKMKKSKGLEKSTERKKDKLNPTEIFGCNSIDHFEQSGANEIKRSEETLVGHCQKKNKHGAAEQVEEERSNKNLSENVAAKGAKTSKSEKRKKYDAAFMREIFGEDSSDIFNGDYAMEPVVVQINANESKTKRNKKEDILQGEDEEMGSKMRRSKELSETATTSDDSLVEKSKRNKKSMIKKSEIEEAGKEYSVSTFDSTLPDNSSTETTQQTKKRKSKKSPEPTVIRQDSFGNKSESKRNNKIKKSEIEEAAKMSSIISPFEDTLDEDNANITETSKRTKKRKSKECHESVAMSDDNLVETDNEVKKSKLRRKSITEAEPDDFKEIPSVSATHIDTTEAKYANFDQEHVGSSSDKETKFTDTNLVENTNKYNNEESSLKETVDFDVKDAVSSQKLLVNHCDKITDDTKRRKSDSKIIIVSNVMLTPGKQKCRKTIQNESHVEDESQDLENIVRTQKDTKVNINMEKEMMEALSEIEACQFKEVEDASKTDFHDNMKASKSISRKNRLLERYASDEMKNQKSVSRHSEENKFSSTMSDTAAISNTDSNNDQLPIINDHEEIVNKQTIVEDPWKRKYSEDQKGPIQVNPPKKRKVDMKSLKSIEETNKDIIESTPPIAAVKKDKKPSKVMKEKDAAKVEQPKRRSERLSSKDSIAQTAELKKVEDEKSRSKSESFGEELRQDTENTYEANSEQSSGDLKLKEESTHIESVTKSPKSKNVRTNSRELNLKEDGITVEQKRRLSSEKIISGKNKTLITDKISIEPVENIETVPEQNNIDLETSKLDIEVSSANNRIEICNKQIVNKITDRHQVSIPTDGIEINVFSDEYKRITDENNHRLSPIIGGLYRNSLTPPISKTKSQQNPSVSYQVSKDKTPPSPNLNKTPSPSQTTVEKINGELPKTRKRITPTPVKDAPVCSFKNILQNNNTIKLFSKNVTVQSHLPEEGSIPILHLEEINFSNFEESQKTYDSSIIKLLDCMNVSNLGCDVSKLCDNSNSLLRKENLTFENSVIEKVESPSRVIVDSVALDAISKEIVTELDVTPTEQDLPKIATSTPKVSVITTPPQIVNNGQIIVSDDIASTLIDSDRKLSCNEAAGSPISDKLTSSSSSTVTAPARFRRRCRMIAVKRE